MEENMLMVMGTVTGRKNANRRTQKIPDSLTP